MNTPKIFKVQLKTKSTKLSVGKMNTALRSEKSSIAKNEDSKYKSYKLLLKEPNKGEVKYTGSQMSGQSAKYLIFKLNQATQIVEVFPCDEWFHFTKDQKYETLDCDQAEEILKRKAKASTYKANTLRRKDKEEKENKSSIQKSNDDEDDRKFFKNYKNFKIFKNNPNEDILEVDNNEEEEGEDIQKYQDHGDSQNNINNDSSDSESISFLKNRESESEDNLSDISREDDLQETNFLQNKIQPSELNFRNKKFKQDQSSASIESIVLSTFQKQKKIPFGYLVKELKSLNFSNSDIQAKLPPIMDFYCKKKIAQGEEVFYLK